MGEGDIFVVMGITLGGRWLEDLPGVLADPEYLNYDVRVESVANDGHFEFVMTPKEYNDRRRIIIPWYITRNLLFSDLDLLKSILKYGYIETGFIMITGCD